MASNRKFFLCGFVNPANSFPSFVVPVFYHQGKFWTQDGLDDSGVLRFLPMPSWQFLKRRRLIRSYSRLPFVTHESWLTLGTSSSYPLRHVVTVNSLFGSKKRVAAFAKVGGQLKHAFAFNRTHVLYGTRAELRRRINAGLVKKCASPFIQLEVASFLGDVEWYSEAVHSAADILRQDNPAVSQNWLDSMISKIDSLDASMIKVKAEA